MRPYRPRRSVASVHQDDPVLLHVVLVGGGGGQSVNVDDSGRRHTNDLKITGAEATTAAGGPDSTRRLPQNRPASSWQLCAVVEGDLVAVRVGEGECPTEGAVDRCGDDGVTVGDESIVNGLDVSGVEPDRGTDAGLSNG